MGHPLSEMYGYVYDGVYQYEDFNEVSPGVFVLKNGIPNNTQERNTIQPGDMKLRDINGDGKVTAEDQTVIGHGLPIHTLCDLNIIMCFFRIYIYTELI